MKIPFKITVMPDEPPALDEILEEFKRDQARKDGGEELLGKIKEFEEKINDEYIADDNSLSLFLMNPGLDKDDFKEAYVKYMGLAFYWQSKQASDFAWHYYAKAQYHLGICESWDRVLSYLVEKDLERQTRAKGGNARMSATARPVMKLFAEFIANEKPSGGWESRAALVKAAAPVLSKTIESWGEDSFPLYTSLPRTLRAWLDGFNDASRLYEEHKAHNENYDNYRL